MKVCEVLQRGVKDLNWFLTEVYIGPYQTPVNPCQTINMESLIWRVLRKQLTAEYASAVDHRETKPIMRRTPEQVHASSESKGYLGPCEISIIELFFKNS